MKNLLIAIALSASLMSQAPVSQETLVKAAMHDWHLRRPLPGLPSLQRPVHVKTGVLACNDAAELINPNKRELVFLGECVLTSHNVTVKVIQPTDQYEYIVAHVAGIVEILWQSQDISDGNIYTAWVDISSLSN
jgi:hypothetical protein